MLVVDNFLAYIIHIKIDVGHLQWEWDIKD